MNIKGQSFGKMIAALRRENGMTQLDLAEKMGVTDKAVSKWERDLSYPDVNSIPKLAEIFGITVDELMQVKSDAKTNSKDKKFSEIISIVLKGVALAMGIAVVVLSFLNTIDTESAVSMLGIGLVCLAAERFSQKD